MPVKLTQEEFVQKAIKTHGDRFDYSQAVYINHATKLTIVCKIHGSFCQTPNNHLRGHGCPTCGGTERLTTEQFIERSRLKHSGKYDYSATKYRQSNKKVLIICPIHQRFFQRPLAHLNGSGCPKCGMEKTRSAKVTLKE
ncbi:hypothetical protein [Chroococcidiopsis sp.]|uniref:hypothetical protein n=1 Tax=Chroococcidiopsis sp. TaxID=3088168 RepID=UPI003F2BBB45